MSARDWIATARTVVTGGIHPGTVDSQTINARTVVNGGTWPNTAEVTRKTQDHHETTIPLE